MFWRREDLIDVRCDCCKSLEKERAYKRPDGLDIVRCESCGLHFICPRPKPELIRELYSEEYFRGSNDNPTGYAEYDAASQAVLRRNEARRRLLIARTLGVTHLGSVLEVGCSTGDFAAVAAPVASSFTGVDLSEHAINIARHRARDATFHCGDTTEIGSAVAGPFDTIFSFEVVEHVLSPETFLADLANRLKPGGFLVLSTPNAECGIRLGFKNWWGSRTSFEHLYFFRLEDLDRLVERAGLVRVAAVTGAGDGRYEGGERKISFLRRAAVALGLRKWAWKLREWQLSKQESPQLFDYEEKFENHNLIVVYRKSSEQSDSQ